jgi:PTH1 family peptidyl-tRNA hydrolase
VVVGEVAGRPVRLVKPQTYMNRSGAVIAPLRASADFDIAGELLVLVDDVALPAGSFRLRGAGSSGGHNGLKDIEAVLDRRDYARLRIGIGPRPPQVEDLADFVLDRCTREEQVAIAAQLDPMAEAVECWLAEDIERAMNRFNR